MIDIADYEPCPGANGYVLIDGYWCHGIGFAFDDELAELELGWRVSWFYTVADFESVAKPRRLSLGWFAGHGSNFDPTALTASLTPGTNDD